MSNRPTDPTATVRSVSTATALKAASRRWTNLIGVSDPDKEEADQQRTDRKRFPTFIHRGSDGLVIWDQREAVTFLSEVTGERRHVCAVWLDDKYPPRSHVAVESMYADQEVGTT